MQSLSHHQHSKPEYQTHFSLATHPRQNKFNRALLFPKWLCFWVFQVYMWKGANELVVCSCWEGMVGENCWLFGSDIHCQLVSICYTWHLNYSSWNPMSHERHCSLNSAFLSSRRYCSTLHLLKSHFWGSMGQSGVVKERCKLGSWNGQKKRGGGSIAQEQVTFIHATSCIAQTSL